MGVKDHKKKAKKNMKCAVITVSSSRVKEDDESGKIISSILETNGHKIIYYNILKDDLELLKTEVQKLIIDGEVEIIILNGGTGISKKDVTIEAVSQLFEKKLSGFGELFRALSYKEIGSASIMSRAIAGVANSKIIICIPGSPNAVRLAVEKIIINELAHMVWEVNR